MKRDVFQDPVVGRVLRFRDHWRGRPALCLLIGSGSGPDGESVRIVGRPVRGGGFTTSWLISYDRGEGNARRAYEYLVRTYDGPIRAEEVRSSEGIGFHQAMMEAGLVSEIDADSLQPPSMRR